MHVAVAEVAEEEGVGDSEELCAAKEAYWELTCGLHNCLYWLYGIELPGREDEPWAEDYKVGRKRGALPFLA